MLAASAVTWLGVRWLLPLLLARPLAAGIRPGRYRAVGPDVTSGSGRWTSCCGSRRCRCWSGRRCSRPTCACSAPGSGGGTHVGTSDLTLPRMLHLGDDATVGYGVALRPWAVEDGRVVVGPVRLERRARSSAPTPCSSRAAAVGPGAMLGEQSALGRGEVVPAGRTLGGLAPAGARDPGRGAGRHARRRPAAGLAGPARWPPRWPVSSVLEVLAIAMVVPSVMLVWSALLGFGVLAGLRGHAAVGPVFVADGLRGGGARAHARAARARPSASTRCAPRSGLRKWIADKLLEMSLTFTNSLYATLYTVPWLRLLGARVGRGAEVSTAAHLDPDLLTLGEESFVADMASVGAATFANGRMLLRRHVRRRPRLRRQRRPRALGHRHSATAP